ncbi:FG-GAP repeat domain-containing protein [Streptomyces sp. NPDC048172]|uniref:FG-GAP repeat domain-containing protein n=1 Tax=Streptomyces sp. NPDC048172 TaxID=3365505 RepID=UPI00371CB413
MLRSKRSRLIAAPIAAVALSLTVAGYQASAGESGSGSEKADTSGAACVADATTLHADLDRDGRTDKIANPGHTGTKMTIQWGQGGGSYGPKQSVSKLLGAKEGEVATAAVGDFDNDNTLDMVVNVVEPSGVDDPSTARVAEYRPGPLKQTDLGSDDARHSDIGEHGEVQALGIANYGDDDYPDLAVLNNAGDGQLDRDVRLSDKAGLGDFDREANEKYGETGTTPEPPAMPTDGWKHFFKPCA